MLGPEPFNPRDEGTIVHVFYRWVTTRPGKTALMERRAGRWTAVSWREFGNKVEEIAFGLRKLGVKKGDRVAILAPNCVAWTFADMAILSLGAVSVPIYATSTSGQVRYILGHSETKAIFVLSEDEAAMIASIRPNLPELKEVISFQPGDTLSGSCDYSLDQICMMGQEERRSSGMTLPDLFRDLRLSDLNAIMYTSGTTGPPKGCLMEHGNIMYICQSVALILPRKRNDLILSFLPLAHAMERHGGQFISIYFAIPTAFATSLETVAEDLREVRPTWSRGVPRFFEKAYHRVQATVEGYSPRRRAIFKWAFAVGKEYTVLAQAKKPVPVGLRVKRGLASLLVFRRIRAIMGGRLRFFISGSAPLAREIIEFFNILGVIVNEGYGLTETTVLASINRFDRFRFGTVGFPIPGCEIRLAGDGEILIRHPGVFRGYYKNEAATREALDENGFMRTGDIGYYDEEGFLVISDRKKDIIITAGGKNITPQNLENALKNHPLISQVFVYGDRRPYLVALITLDEEALAGQAARFGITLDPAVHPAENRDLQRVLERFLHEQNMAFSRVEQIKMFKILREDFTQESGEITPTQKIRRKVIAERYRNLLEEMYRVPHSDHFSGMTI